MSVPDAKLFVTGNGDVVSTNSDTYIAERGYFHVVIETKRQENVPRKSKKKSTDF